MLCFPAGSFNVAVALPSRLNSRVKLDSVGHTAKFKGDAGNWNTAKSMVVRWAAAENGRKRYDNPRPERTID
jgi:hypothetical protein